VRAAHGHHKDYAMNRSTRWSLFFFLLTLVPALSGTARAQEEPFSIRTGVGGNVPEQVMPVVNVAAALAEDVTTKPGAPLRFALTHDVKITLDQGQWETVGDTALWRLKVTSAGARNLNLGFTTFEMPEGGALYLYPSGYTGGAPRRSVRRAGAEANETHHQYWSPVVTGDSVTVEVSVPKALRSQLRLELTKVNHGYRSFDTKDDVSILSGSCNVDVVCSQGDLYRNEIRAVGVLQLNGSRLCTGSAINNTGGKRPLFITADHCGLRASNAASTVVYWNFQNSTCRPVNSGASGGDGDGSLSQFNSGAIFLATSATSDFTLVELDDAPAAAFNVFLAGWDRRPGPFTDGAVGIHHPNVDEKRISLSNRATEDDNGTHHRIWWRPNGIGVTEPGSSGSPIYSKQGRFIGQLTGGGSACGVADSSMWDVYGKLSRSWDGGGAASNRARDHLDPVGTAPMMIDGRNWNDGGGTPTPTPSLTPTPTTGPSPTPTRTPTPTPTTGPSPTPTPTVPAGGNLALNRPATGSTPCNVNEGPAKAVNGSVSGGNTDKWCSLVAGTKFLQVDLGSAMTVSSFVVKHAAAGGEGANFNTRSFDIQTSLDNVTFQTAVTVAANTAAISNHAIAARSARYVRLNVTVAEQQAGGAARIYELEVYGAGGPVTPTPTPTLTPTGAPTFTPTPTLTPTATPTTTPGTGFVEITPGGAAVLTSTNDGNVGANTVDNNLGTRWSGMGDGAWIRYDLGTARVVTRVSIAVYRGNERRNRFDLQHSMNGTDWSPILTGEQTNGLNLAEQPFTFPGVSARYIRYVGHTGTLNAGGTTPWNSLTEVSIFTGTGAMTPTPPPTGDVVIQPGDVLNSQAFEWRSGFTTRQSGTYGQYRVDMTAGTTYTFTTSLSAGGGNDTVLYLLDSAQAVVAQDDNSGDGNHSILSFQPQAAGSYFLRLRAFSAGASGSCQLAVGGVAPGNPLLPDLETVVNSGALRDAFIVTESGRKRMRFSNGVANRGVGPVEVYGVVAADGTTQAFQRIYNDNGTKTTHHVGTFSFAGHGDHNHWHYDDFSRYDLRSLSDTLVATSDKVSFCIEDFERSPGTSPPGTPANMVYNCSNQGLSVGWTDRYRNHLDGQWIDITGVPNGTYRLVSTVDPELRLHESTRANNRAEVTVVINGNTVTVQ
jgi:hypothetical protein